MLSSWSLPALLALFAAAAGIIWFAGIKLSDTTDILTSRLGLGEALGGLILLAIATNLPEIAITVSAAWHGNLGIAIGNLLGGIGVQTLVLVALDAVSGRGDRPLTYRAASLSLVLEGTLVVAVLILAIMASRLPESLIVARVAPGGVLIALVWMLGIWLVGRARNGLPWHAGGTAPNAQSRPQGHSQHQKSQDAGARGITTAHAATIFGLAGLVTLVCGVALEMSGDAIADQIGMSGVLFGATVLAAATSLPELSTGIASVRLGDERLAISDIFGGNAFLPVLFLAATVISGSAALPQAQGTDIYLAGLGVLLTCAYISGLIFRPQRRVLGMGIDSLTVLLFYAIGIVGLFAITLMQGS